MKKTILTKENLLELGFKEEYVPALESGDKPFTYYVYVVLDAFEKERCVLITNADDDADEGFRVEFFNMEEVGYYDDYETVKELINVIEKANN
ncbi:MAG: hypothetical protein ACOC22_03295 [bacterium]